MKRVILIFAIVFIYLLPVNNALANPTNGSNLGGNSVSWDYWSKIVVTETINGIGGGLYRYSYSFVNTDDAAIWHFGVYTTFQTQGTTGGTLFIGHSGWGGPAWTLNNDMLAEYVGTNLDPAILGATNTYTMPIIDVSTAIQAGEVVSGYSFVAATYDSSPKYYYYETIVIPTMYNYTQTHPEGNVAAVGLTVVIPAPSAVLLVSIGTGFVGWLRRHRVF